MALFIFLIAAWRWLWGSCWNPLEVACFQGPGEGDHLQHFYGWMAYAYGDPRLEVPPVISNWSWPFNTPLLYTDSIPMAAILLRPVGRISGIVFQYFSALSLISILASGTCGLIIGWKRYSTPYAGVALGLLLGLAPPAVIRLAGHEALGLHALLIIPLTLLILRVQLFWPWPLILFVAFGVHAYFVPMVIILLIVRLFSRDFRHSRLGNSGYLNAAATALMRVSRGMLPPGLFMYLADAAQVLVAIVGGYIIFGYSYGKFNVAPKGDIWSANLLAILDPQNQSSIFKPLSKVEPFQWEGFSYLGVAATLFVSFGIYRILAGGVRGTRAYRPLFPSGKLFSALIAAAFVFALGPTLYLGSVKILSYSKVAQSIHIDTIYQLFRSCGRFSWLLYYTALLWGFDQVARYTRNYKALLVIVLVALLETHIPALANTKSTIKEHYDHGKEWLSKTRNANGNENLYLILKEADKLINATGDPNFTSKLLPKYFAQSANPSIKTNYHPYMLARSPKGFTDFYSQQTCTIISATRPSRGSPKRYLYIASESALSECQDLGLKQIVSLSEGYAIYSYPTRVP